MAKSRRGGASVPMVSVKSLPMRDLPMTRKEDVKVVD